MLEVEGGEGDVTYLWEVQRQSHVVTVFGFGCYGSVVFVVIMYSWGGGRRNQWSRGIGGYEGWRVWVSNVYKGCITAEFL